MTKRRISGDRADGRRRLLNKKKARKRQRGIVYLVLFKETGGGPDTYLVLCKETGGDPAGHEQDHGTHRQTNGAPPQTSPNGIGTGQGTRTIRPAGHLKRQADSSHGHTARAGTHTGHSLTHPYVKARTHGARATVAASERAPTVPLPHRLGEEGGRDCPRASSNAPGVPDPLEARDRRRRASGA